MHLWPIDWGWLHLPSVYMCILLYVKLIWCNGFACTYARLKGGSICLWYICALSYVSNWFAVMVVQTSMLEWGGPSDVSIYVHSPICGLACTYGQLTRGVHLPLVYMCIVLCVKLMWCNGLVCSYGWLNGGPSPCSIYVDSLMCETYLV